LHNRSFRYLLYFKAILLTCDFLSRTLLFTTGFDYMSSIFL